MSTGKVTLAELLNEAQRVLGYAADVEEYPCIGAEHRLTVADRKRAMHFDGSSRMKARRFALEMLQRMSGWGE